MTRSAKKRVAPVAAEDQAGGPPSPIVGVSRPEDVEIAGEKLKDALDWIGRSEQAAPRALGTFVSVFTPIEPAWRDPNPWSREKTTT
jgi:hypothetical protein